MKSEKTDKKKIKISNRIVYVISLLLIGLSIGAVVVFAINSWDTGYKVASGSTNLSVQYYAPQFYTLWCGYVDNYTGKYIFIPTNTMEEWFSFVNNSPVNTDGCTDSNSFPAQTGWFASSNSCGSWDYNCDGALTKRWTNGSDDRDCSVYNWSCDSGWDDNTVPDCGVTKSYFNGDCWVDPVPIPDISFCESSSRTQQCH